VDIERLAPLPLVRPVHEETAHAAL
jgi:hypothetical protein